MSRRKFFILTIAALFILPLLAACSGSGANEINVTEGTTQNAYTLQLSKDSAKAGQITFHISNDSQSLTHEFLIIKTDLSADQLPLAADGSTVDVSQLTVVDQKKDIAPGDKVDLTATLEAGHYALICNLPGHYAQGMYADFTVNP